VEPTDTRSERPFFQGQRAGTGVPPVRKLRNRPGDSPQPRHPNCVSRNTPLKPRRRGRRARAMRLRMVCSPLSVFRGGMPFLWEGGRPARLKNGQMSPDPSGCSGIRVFGSYRLFATKEKEGNGSRKRSNPTAGGRGRPPSHKTLSFSGQKPPLENGEEDIPTPRWPEVERSIPFPLRHNDHPKTRPNMTLSIPKERTKRPRSITHLFEFRDIKVIWMKTHPISSL